MESWVRERTKKLFSQGTRFIRRKKKSINEGRRGNKKVVNWIQGDLAVDLCFLVFTKEPMNGYRYLPKYWFLIMGIIPQDHVPFYFITRGSSWKEGDENKLSCYSRFVNHWFTLSHNRDVSDVLGNRKRKRLQWWWRWGMHHVDSVWFAWLDEPDVLSLTELQQHSFFFTKWAVMPDAAGQHDMKFAKWLIWWVIKEAAGLCWRAGGRWFSVVPYVVGSNPGKLFYHSWVAKTTPEQ